MYAQQKERAHFIVYFHFNKLHHGNRVVKYDFPPTYNPCAMNRMTFN